MDIITVNVGQGSLAIVRHNDDAIIVDSYIPPSADETVAYVKGILAALLKNYFVRGLILTGFDADHSDASGVGLVLKNTDQSGLCILNIIKIRKRQKMFFRLLTSRKRKGFQTDWPLKKFLFVLIKLNPEYLKGYLNSLILSYFLHILKIWIILITQALCFAQGKGAGGFSYLITGDTENSRWDTINRLFGKSLLSDVMAAPHHGAKTGANVKTLLLVAPNTILISAGVDNQYGHPDSQAVAVFSKVAKHVYSTHVSGGVSLITSPGIGDFETKLIK